jgi:aldehyde:ferredoxin oxidoreductase
LGACKIIDYDFNLECNRLAVFYGFDTLSLARTIAFAIDLYEKGILTQADTDGMHLEYGHKELVYSLIEKIGRREGIGDILANGVYRAARLIGRGAEDHAHHTKKMEYHQIMAGMSIPLFALGASVVDKGDMTRMYNAPLGEIYSPSREKREARTTSPYWNYPEEYNEYYVRQPSYDGTDYEPICQFVAYETDRYTILDLTGICSFWAAFLEYPPVNSRALIAELVACVTGLDIDEAALTTIAGRTLSLIRAINTRFGLRRKDDSIAKPFFKLPPFPYFNSLDPELFDKWIDRYYELKGWNKEGVPTRESLRELGLDDVAQELEKKGFLTD